MLMGLTDAVVLALGGASGTAFVAKAEIGASPVVGWLAGLGYKGVQIPTWVTHFVDVEKAASSKAYADDVNATVAKHGLQVTELASHIIGQLVAVHPAYDTLSDGFASAMAQIIGATGAQILQNLGVGKLRHLGPPLKYAGLTGYDLEVVESIPFTE